MKRFLIAFLPIVAVILSAGQGDQFSGIDRFIRPEGFAPPYKPPTTIKYGPRLWQRISFFGASRKIARAPLIVTIGGEAAPMGPYPLGWMTHRLNDAGYAYASPSYDTDETKFAGAMDDIVRAIAVLREQADKRRIDPDRIVLLGIGGGGHVATLLGTDPTYLERGGVPFSSIRSVVSINGHGFDIPERMRTATRFRTRGYEEIFGADPAEQARFSPVNHLAAPNVPSFLFLAPGFEKTVVAESTAMAAKLREAGADSMFVALPRYKEKTLSTTFLAEKNGPGKELIDFLAKTVSR